MTDVVDRGVVLPRAGAARPAVPSRGRRWFRATVGVVRRYPATALGEIGIAISRAYMPTATTRDWLQMSWDMARPHAA